MGLKPDFALTVGSADVTARFRDRLMSLTLIDNSGEESDTVEIVLDDRGYAIESPRKGAAIAVSLGYAGADLIYMGAFVVDEVEPSGPPDIMTIRGKAADMRDSLKAPKTRAWRATTLRAIVGQIAREHGLEPAIGDALGGRAIAHRDQSNESDLHFLTRLGRDFGAVAAPKDGKLVFAPNATGQSASGRALPSVTLDRAAGDLIEWRGPAPDREASGKVRARWRDRAGARTRFAEAGDGEPVRTLRHMHASQALAQAAANAELERSKRAQNGIELTCAGRPQIVAQTPITTQGLRPDMNGDWIAQTVEHRLEWSSAGYVTTITGTKK